MYPAKWRASTTTAAKAVATGHANERKAASIKLDKAQVQHEQLADEEETWEYQPYLKRLKSLENAFPFLKSFLGKLANADKGRELVIDHFLTKHEPPRSPGRCICLQFEENNTVSRTKDYEKGFEGSGDLRKYLQKNPADASRKASKRRLFILEDLEVDYIDALGHGLGVDPSVFSEQMNTWNFTDSKSIPCRTLPSVLSPEQSFTLRYYEMRTIADPRSVDVLKLQMTFAVNRRKYERWRDIDLPSSGTKDNRHAFIRRCASFWTSQEKATDVGWDAVLLVDPGMAASCIPLVPPTTGNPDKEGFETTYILQDPVQYKNRASLWRSSNWESEKEVKAVRHVSKSYHAGCATVFRPAFSCHTAEDEVEKFTTIPPRDLTSLLDENIFYWTKIASKELVEKCKANSANVTHFLLKHIAQHWVHQLELLNSTIAKGEYLSDDYQATIDDNLSQKQWKADLISVNDITKDINYMRRQMNHFWRTMILNIERLGIQLGGGEGVDEKMPDALKDAQKDFLTVHYRMQPLRERAEALMSVANDLANLRAAFRGVHDGEFGLRLSLFASIVFPLTLVASIFSMNDSYLPGTAQFWKFWAISLPFVFAFGLVLVYGRKPYKVFKDVWDYFVALWDNFVVLLVMMLRDWKNGGENEESAEVKPKKWQVLLRRRVTSRLPIDGGGQKGSGV